MKSKISVILIGIGLLVFLAGCAASPNNGMSYAESQRQWRENRLAGNRAKCADYGFTAGTNSFAQCMQQERDRTAAEAGNTRKRDTSEYPVNCTTIYLDGLAYTSCQ